MKRLIAGFLVFSLIVLCGCESYVCSLKRTFRQAAVINEEDLVQARSYIRHTPVYDYLNTIDGFYFLWDTPTVQATAQALADAEHNCATVRVRVPEQRFIVLMDGEKDDWSFVLHMGDAVYQPTICRYLELSPAYKTIFGRCIMRHKKNVYELIFAAESHDGPVKLDATNTAYRVTTTWQEVCDDVE